jgi:hypothetical protein
MIILILAINIQGASSLKEVVPLMQKPHDALRRCRQVCPDNLLASVEYLIEIPNSGDGTINKTRITIDYMLSANPNQPPDL